jgi:hypothetical protein
MCCSLGKARRRPRNRSTAPCGSWILASCTRATSRKASVSGNDVALAPLDALAGIDAARTATFGGRHALAVDEAGRGSGVAPHSLTGGRDEVGTDPPPGSVIAPAVEVALHGRAGRKVPRQGAPLAAGRQDIEDRIDNRPQLPLARPTKSPTGRQQRLNLRPFSIRGSACIPQFIAPILLPSGFSPNHVNLSRCFATTTESQGTEITQLISGQPLSQPLRMRLSVSQHSRKTGQS